MIQIKLKDSEWKLVNDKPTATWELKLRDWVWYSEFEDGQISFLAASDGDSGRFKWGLMQEKKS
ncbi:MAG: hypothetical protein IIC02_08785 [Planctomycetes bacterium]|nr:hypothetical protein [Planctomycetota bacterium]